MGIGGSTGTRNFRQPADIDEIRTNHVVICSCLRGECRTELPTVRFSDCNVEHSNGHLTRKRIQTVLQRIRATLLCTTSSLRSIVSQSDALCGTTLRQADSVLEKVHRMETGDSVWVEVLIPNVLRI